MEKRDLHSPDLAARNVEKIAALFPSVITEAADADGNIVRSVDFDLLRQELSDHIVEGPQERYRLDWPGKRAAAFAANAPIAKTLRPMREESVDFDTTKNLFIEGDNLDALKLLQESYLGKVKLIYIDPPYNTGNDYVYADRFAEDAASYLLRSGQKSSENEKLTANPSTGGRYHSDWLSMIYSRLKLSRALLSDDGAIVVSIDDHERASLELLLDELYGPKSFVGAVIWRKKSSPDARSTVGAVHDYLLLYVRNAERPKQAIGKMALSENRINSFTNPDADDRGPWASVDMTGMTGRATKDQFFEIALPSGRKIRPPAGRSWGVVERTFKQLLADNRIWFGREGDSAPRVKRFLAEADGQTVSTFWDLAEVGSSEEATGEVESLFGGVRVFDTPKPTRLMRRLLDITTNSTDGHIVLDFFAGSASMGDAVLRTNAADGGNRKFIMVQLNEAPTPGSVATQLGYASIAAVSRERLRQVRASLLQRDGGASVSGDLGFRALSVDSSNMTDLYRTSDHYKQNELDFAGDSVKSGRTSDDLFFQVLLDWGLDLSMETARVQLDAGEVIVGEDGALVACFDASVQPDAVRYMADIRPLRAVFRDSGFATDAARINAEQVFRELSPATEVRTI